MNDIAIEIDAMHKWKVDGKWIHIEEIENLEQLVRERSKDRMWSQLSKQRQLPRHGKRKRGRGLRSFRQNTKEPNKGQQMENDPNRRYLYTIESM